MKRNGQLSAVLHVMLLMAEHESPITSEMMAKALSTNPVVVRRILSGLRDKGYVRSEKGHGGGWMLACKLGDVTLRDIYNAIGCPSLLAIGHRNESPDCLVEQAVNGALSHAFQEAEALLLERFSTVTLATLSADVHARHLARQKLGGHGEPRHSRKAKK